MQDNAKVQELALDHVEPHPLGLFPSIQLVQVPLQGLPTLQQINTSTQLGVVCKLTEGVLDSKSSIKLSNKMDPSTDPLGTRFSPLQVPNRIRE